MRLLKVTNILISQYLIPDILIPDNQYLLPDP